MDSPAQFLSFDRGTLLLRGAPRDLTDRPPAGVIGRGDPRTGGWRCDALHFRALEAALRARAPAAAIQVARWTPVRWPAVKLPSLREDQTQAVQAWMAERRGVLVMPTGTGKTEVALRILHDLAVSALVVSPVRDLMYQWHQRILDRLGYDAGIIGDNTFNVRPVSVTTYDSACIHMPELGDRFGLIVFDECHHLPGPIRADAARMCAAPYRLGLTATPERSDGREAALDGLIGPVVFRVALPAVRGTVLADYDVVRIPVHLSDAEQARYDQCGRVVQAFVRERRAEYPDYGGIDLRKESGRDPGARRAMQAQRARQAIEDRAQEKLRVLEDLFRLHPGQRVIVFTGSNAMAREVSLRFLVPCLLHHCRKKERKEILDGFRRGQFPAIVANQVLDEGVDIPEAKVGIVLGGMASTKQAKQRLGRILRRVGDQRAILYEVVCGDTREAGTSRRRRKSDAYEGTRHLRL